MKCHEVKARLFFEILESGDTNLLGTKEHASDFKALLDDFFVKSNDKTAQQKLLIRIRVSALQLKLQTLETIIETQNLPLDDTQQKKIADCLKTLKIKFEDLANEIAILKNEIQILILENFDDKELSKDFNFSDTIVSFENVLERQINDDLTLEKFISYQKTCQRIIKHRQQNKK